MKPEKFGDGLKKLLAKNRVSNISNNVGSVKHFWGALARALRRARLLREIVLRGFVADGATELFRYLWWNFSHVVSCAACSAAC